MANRMPSTIGHSLAGLAIGLAAQPHAKAIAPASHPLILPLAGAAMAAAPDLDLLLPHFHRAATHSIGATFLVMIVAAGVTGKVTGRIWWRLVLVLGLAQWSHLFMDWLGVDPSIPSGIEALWPFSTDFYVSGVNWFPPTERRIFSVPDALAINVRAVLVEVTTMVPIVALAWWITRRRRSRGRSSGQGVPQRPFV